jgi:hypothetical protein
VVSLRLEVLNFKQKQKESLGESWVRFNSLTTTGSNLAIQDPTLLQHFYMGLVRILCNSLIQPLEELPWFVC